MVEALGTGNVKKAWNVVQFCDATQLSGVLGSFRDIPNVADANVYTVKLGREDGRVSAAGNVRRDELVFLVAAHVCFQHGIINASNEDRKKVAKLESTAHFPFLKTAVASSLLNASFDSRSLVIETFDVSKAGTLKDEHGVARDNNQRSQGLMSQIVRRDGFLLRTLLCCIVEKRSRIFHVEAIKKHFLHRTQ